MKKSLLILGFYVIFLQLNYAQMSAGATLGCMNYKGDLVKGYIDLKEINISYGVFVARHYANSKILLKGQLQRGKISGNDANYPSRQQRGLKFYSFISFVGVGLDYAPFARASFNSDGYFIPQINLFVSTGLGATFFNPKVQGLDDKAPDKIAEISKMMLSLPLGGGIRFDMTEEWSLALQGSLFITATDYLDGVSKAAVSSNNDYYFFYGLSLARKWGKSKSH